MDALPRSLAKGRLVHHEILDGFPLCIVAEVVHEGITEELRVACRACQITGWDDEVRIAIVYLDRQACGLYDVKFLFSHFLIILISYSLNFLISYSNNFSFPYPQQHHTEQDQSQVDGLHLVPGGEAVEGDAGLGTEEPVERVAQPVEQRDEESILRCRDYRWRVD